MEDISAVVFINLDRRTDRLAEITGEFEKMGIKGAIRFPAISHEHGGIGCTKSHLAVIKMAKENGWHNVLIFEDDFMFIVDKPTFHSSLNTFFQDKIPYDVLMLAYNLRRFQIINRHVGYARRSLTASGYIVHNRMYDRLISLWEENITKFEAEPHNKLYMNDVSWFKLQETSEWLYLRDRIGIQRPSYSDIENRVVAYGV
jgi:glycosyl transferase family 25